ncbi:MAG: calcium/sodium antiporter [Streptosporangiaceae bacterium]
MVSSLLLLLLGLPLLTFAAEQLVLGASRTARRAGISAVTVGVLVIGLGTSAPELLVSGSAAAGGHTGLAVGNLVGSNVINLTLLLGLAGLMAPVLVRSSVLRREAPLSVGAVTVFGILLLTGLGLAAGLTLTALLVAVLAWMLRTARTQPEDILNAETEEFLDSARPHRLPIEITRLILGLAGTLAGTEALVRGGVDLASRFGMSQQLIGFTLVAFGTSLPELVTTVQAQRHGETDLLVGNLLGSNLINSLAGGAIIAFTAPATLITDSAAVICVMVGVSGLAWALLTRGQRLTRPESAVLAAAYLVALPLLT